MTFTEVKAFFIGWGLAPAHEDHANIGNGDGAYVMNSACFEKMKIEAATLHGSPFRKFVSSVVDAIDGEFYLTAETWDEFEEVWYNNR